MSDTESPVEQKQPCVLRIGPKKTMQLLTEYKKEECLWKTTLDDYPNRNERIKAAERIAKKLNIENFEWQHVLMKFRNLRSSYYQEIKKIAHSKKLKNPTKLYKPHVMWFSLMDSFLRPHLQPQRSRSYSNKSRAFLHNPDLPVVRVIKLEDINSQEDWTILTDDSAQESNNDESAQESINGESAQEPNHDDSAQETNCEDCAQEPSNDGLAQEPSNSECPSDNDEVSNHSRVKRRRSNSVSVTPSDHTQNRTFVPSNDSHSVTRSEDTFDNFGRYVASLLRGLPRQQALRLQPGIVSMIVNAELQQLDRHAGVTHNDSESE